MEKTDKVDKTMQTVKCGAVVRLDDAVLEHGILFMHPDMPLFRMYIHVDLEKGIVDKYNFELVKKESPEITQFAVVVVDAVEPLISMPEKKLII